MFDTGATIASTNARELLGISSFNSSFSACHAYIPLFVLVQLILFSILLSKLDFK
jgi:hypothetical protein